MRCVQPVGLAMLGCLHTPNTGGLPSSARPRAPSAGTHLSWRAAQAGGELGDGNPRRSDGQQPADVNVLAGGAQGSDHPGAVGW